LKSVAQLFGDAHRRGFVHRDAHPRNILIQRAEPNVTRAFFVDVLAGVFRRERFSSRPTIDSLGQLAHAMQRVATPTERGRFLIHFVDSMSAAAETDLRPDSKVADRRETLKNLAGAIDRAARRQAVRLAFQRDRRLRGDGRYFSKIKLGDGWSANCALRLSRRHVFAEPTVPDRTVEHWQTLLRKTMVLIKDERRSGSLTLDGLRLDRYEPTGWCESVRWTLFASPARRLFRRCHQLRHRDIEASLFLGYMERRSNGLVTECVMVRSAHPLSTGRQS
jgi:hypothetical protein